MGFASIALNERRGDNEEDIEPEDENELDSSKHYSGYKHDNDTSQEFECEDENDSAPTITPDKPPSMNANEVDRHKFHPQPAD